MNNFFPFTHVIQSKQARTRTPRETCVHILVCLPLPKLGCDGCVVCLSVCQQEASCLLLVFPVGRYAPNAMATSLVAGYVSPTRMGWLFCFLIGTSSVLRSNARASTSRAAGEGPGILAPRCQRRREMLLRSNGVLVRRSL